MRGGQGIVVKGRFARGKRAKGIRARRIWTPLERVWGQGNLIVIQCRRLIEFLLKER